MDIKERNTLSMNINLAYNLNNYKINEVQKQSIKSLRFTSSPKTVFIDSLNFKQKQNYVFLYELMQNLKSTLSKEDVSKLNRQIKLFLKNFNEQKLPELIKKSADKSNEMLELITKSGITAKKENDGIKYSNEVNKMTYSTRNKIKDILIQQMATREVIKYYKPYTKFLDNPTLGDWFIGFEKKQQMPNMANSLFEHPIDKALFLAGKYTDEDLSQINKKTKLFGHLDINKIFIKKDKILNKINKILDKPNQNIYGVFSNAELRNLKKLSIENESFSNVLKEKNIFNKKMESVIFNCNKNLSAKGIGEHINGVGMVIKKTKVYDREKKQEIPCLIAFDKSSSMYNLKLLRIDNNFENRIIDFSKKYTDLKNTSEFKNNIEILNQEAESIINEEKNLLVSEISFKLVNKKIAKSYIEDIKGPLENNEILKIINDVNTNVFPIIENFQNHNSKRYINGSREIALPLVHLLIQHDCEPLLIKALAINSNRSPVGLYLKYGFEPISHNKEKIKEIMLNSENGFDYKEPVWLYLPKKSTLKDIVLKEKPLKEILEFKKNNSP